MFCLQALLPLLLFPQAASSPFFMVAYLTGIVLNHRPCVYCLVLFFGALYASCFWSDNGTCWANVWPAYPEGSSLSWETADSPGTANIADLPSNPLESLVSTVTWFARPFTTTKENYELWVKTWFTPMHEEVLLPWPGSPGSNPSTSTPGASVAGTPS